MQGIKKYKAVLAMYIAVLLMFETITVSSLPMISTSVSAKELDEETVSANISGEEDISAQMALQAFLSEGVVVIDETTFPDAQFRTYVEVEVDTSGDGYLQANEIKETTEMDLAGLGIEDLTEIFYFKYLTKLDVKNNNLKRLNLRQNTILEELNASGNALEEIELKKCTQIQKVDVSDNKLAEIDVTSRNLTDLDMSNNKITVQEMSGYPDLVHFNASDNQLEELLLSENTKLESLDISNNRLTELNVEKNTKLTSLKCANNSLAELSLRENDRLTTLYTDNNHLAYITLHGSGAAITDKQLGAQIVEAEAESDGQAGRKAVMGFTDKSHVKDVKSTDPTMRYDAATGEILFQDILPGFTYTYTFTDTFDESGMTVQVNMKGIAITEENFPDEVFREHVLIVLDNGSGYLMEDEISAIAEINVFNKGIKNLDGVEFFTEVETLNVGKNALTALNIGNNKKLSQLNCSQNLLTNLVISNNKMLEEIDCSENKLKNINVQNHPLLRKLSIGQNQVTEIDVALNTELEELYVANNQIDRITLTANTKLESLDISNNRIEELDVSEHKDLKELSCGGNRLPYISVYDSGSALTGKSLGKQETEGVPSASGDGNGRYVDLVPSPYHTLVSLKAGSQVNFAYPACVNTFHFEELLEEFTYQYNIGGESMDVHVTITEIPINDVIFPDDAFRSYLKVTYDDNENGYFDGEEIKKVKDINVSASEIRELKGIETFSSLKTLEAGDNQIQKLDVSKNKELEILNVNNNQLTEETLLGLDAVGSSLKELYANGNHFTTLDIKANKQLEVLELSDNECADLDISENGKLRILDLSGNQLASIDSRKNTELEALSIDRNQLTEMNIGKNVLLSKLSVSGNSLTKLDISEQTELEELNVADNAFEALDVSRNTGIELLNAAGNQLEEIAIDMLPKLRSLKVEKNQLAVLDLASNDKITELYCGQNTLADLDVSNMNLEILECESNKIETLDLAKSTGLTVLKCDNNRIRTLDLTNASGIEAVSCENNRLAHIKGLASGAKQLVFGQQNAAGNAKAKPDTVGIWEIDVDMPKELYGFVSNLSPDAVFNQTSGCFEVEAELPQCTYTVSMNGYGMDVDYKAYVVDMKENFPDEAFRDYIHENFDTDKNWYLNDEEREAVASVDVKGLTIADLIGIEHFPNLISLDCSFNDLTDLDVSANTKLTGLYCKNNKIDSLDLRKNTALTQLYCNGNGMTSLDISECTILGFLACEDNALTELETGNNKALTYINCSNNRLTDITVREQKELTELNCSNNELSGIDIRYNIYLKTLYCAGNLLESINVSKNSNLEVLDVSRNQLEVLKVNANPELNMLKASENRLQSLDTSKNAKLALLDVSSNFLESVSENHTEALDLSNNEELTTLHCEDNRLETLNLDHNSKLTVLHAGKNNLADIEITGLSELVECDVKQNNFTKLSLSENTLLEYLDCSENQLAQLSLEDNTSLKELNCDGNRLKTIQLYSGLVSGNELIRLGSQSPEGIIVRNDDKETWEMTLGIEEKERSHIAGMAEEKDSYDAESDTATVDKVRETVVYSYQKNGYLMEVGVSVSNYEDVAPKVTEVRVTPGSCAILRGKSETFTAVVEGTNYPDQKVEWNVSGGKSKETHISNQGLLKVGSDETAPSLTVTAVSAEDTSKKAVIKITVQSQTKVAGVNISSDKEGKKTSVVHLQKGKKQKLYATVTGTHLNNFAVTWSIDGKVKPGTTIGQDGVLSISKSETASSFTVKAVAKQDGKTQASIQIKTMNIPPKKGKKLSLGGGTYQVTKAAKVSGDRYTLGKVTYIKNNSSKASRISIPDTIKVQGITYQVTEIKAKALRNNKKVTTIDIGQHVKKIGKQAFEGCTKLKKVTIKSKHFKKGKIGKKAFSGTHKKIKVTVPSKKISSYQRLLKKAGISETAKYSKK